MNEIIPKDHDEQLALWIANEFICGKSEIEIAKDREMDIMQVKYILADDKIQKYINSTTQNEELQMNLRRIRRANMLQDTIIDRVEAFLDDPEMPVAKRKDSHVSLLKDVLLKQLPNTISKTIGLAIQMNFGKGIQTNNVSDETLQSILKRLPPGQIILFWELIDKVGNLFLKGETDNINDLGKTLERYELGVNTIIDSEVVTQ